MKFSNILSLFLVLALIQACNPLDSEIDALDIPTTISTDLEVTLTEDDYDFVGLSFPNFSSEDDAKDLIPQILTENYPQFGKGSSAIVHYDLFNPIRINEAYTDTLTADDYMALGQNFGTLSNAGDIIEAVEYKHPAPEANDLVTLTYEWYCGGCPEQGTRTSKVTYYDGRWYIAYVPTAEDYTFMGQSFPNFDSRTTARERIAILLGTKYLFDDPGTFRTSVFVYTYVDGNGVRQFEDFMAVFQFDGEVWQPFQDVVSRTLQLGHDGNTWVPDNTIKYTLTGADYVAIAAATETSNPSGSGSMSTFGNYDLALWSEDQIISSVGNRLLELFPKVDDQKYLVFYNTWEPGAGVRSIHLIYKGGAYEKVQ
ncbi:MAG: hypothetical protein R2791_01940 [Saprospiraceae bacterium]